MLNETTIGKLHEMRLPSMAESFRQQLLDQSFNGLCFEDRFGLMVDTEWARRKNNKLAKLIHKAELSFSEACIEDIEYHSDRKLDKMQITRLSTCSYIQEKHNIIILGASGAGKTYLSCAFGIAACRNFYTVKYIRLPDLLNDLAVARGEGIYQKVMKQYKLVSLLILDEW
ncbi:MAG: ATP-binding protein, partial [Desulfitobacteriaceae bacterium]